MAKKAVYVAIGTRLSGTKEVLGMWIGGSESAKYWLGVMNEIRNRGVEDIMIVSADGLSGFCDAISAVFPKAEIQRCIVHQIRYSTKFIYYKDLKQFTDDLKLIYQAPTEDMAMPSVVITKITLLGRSSFGVLTIFSLTNEIVFPTASSRAVPLVG